MLLALPAPPGAPQPVEPRAAESAPAAEARLGFPPTFPAKPEVHEEARGSKDGVSSAGSAVSKVMRSSEGRLAAVTASLQAANAEDKQAKKEKKKEEQKKKKKEQEKKKKKQVGEPKAAAKGKMKKAEPAAETESAAETEPAASSAPAVKTDRKRQHVKRDVPGSAVKQQMRFGSPRTKVSLHMKWGCAKCVYKPGCTPSCWKQRKQQKPE